MGVTFMKERLFRLVKLVCGLATIGLSITLTKQIGSLNPWNVLNDGLSSTVGITIGQANTTAGIIIIMIDILAKEKLGIGTVLNALLIGRFTDLFVGLNASLGLVPKITEIWLQIPLCFVAILINSVGMYLYLSAQLRPVPSLSASSWAVSSALAHSSLSSAAAPPCSVSASCWALMLRRPATKALPKHGPSSRNGLPTRPRLKSSKAPKRPFSAFSIGCK